MRAKLESLLNLQGGFSWKEAAIKVYPVLGVGNRVMNQGGIPYIADAFLQNYLYEDFISSWFIRYVANVTNLSPEIYFACYAFFGQSSCMGKSRLLLTKMETDDAAIFLVYINCRASEATGFPLSDQTSCEFVANLLATLTFSEMSNYICGLLILILKLWTTQERSYFILNKKPKSYFLKDLGIKFEMIKDKALAIGDSTLSVAAEIQQIIENLYYVDGNIRKKVYPVIAFDEAACFVTKTFEFKDKVFKTDPGVSELAFEHVMIKMNTFRLIRRVLNQLKRALWKCLFIFAGTNTRFGNFIPSKLRDPSTRGEFGPTDDKSSGVQLLDPLILHYTWNVYAHMYNCKPSEITDWRKHLSSPDYQYQLINYGRPMWGAMMHSHLKAQGIDASQYPLPSSTNLSAPIIAITSLAYDKLPYEIKEKDPFKNGLKVELTSLDQVECALSVISLCVAGGFYHGSMAGKLVEKRMAILLNYNYQAEYMCVTYPPEPVLAFVALSHLKRHPVQILNDVEMVNDFIHVHVGDMGEFIVKVLLLLSTPSLSLSMPYGPAKEFLLNILGPEKMKELEESENEDTQAIVNEGLVCFSYFGKMQGIMKRPMDNMKILSLLNCALSATTNFTGLDMVIPVLLEHGRWASINVQAKNHCRELYSDKLAPILKGLTVGSVCADDMPRINLVLNVCPFVCNPIEVGVNLFDYKNSTTILIEGITSGFSPVFAKYDGLADRLYHLSKVGRFDKRPNGEKFRSPFSTMDLAVCHQALETHFVWADLSDNSDNEVSGGPIYSKAKRPTTELPNKLERAFLYDKSKAEEYASGNAKGKGISRGTRGG